MPVRRLLTAFVPLALLTTCHSAGDVPVERPNIVLIVADDLGFGELGCYGQTKIRTPNLDRLAREGLRFTQMNSAAPVCAPSRCALLTGKHTGHAAVRDNHELQPEGQAPLPTIELTLPEILRAQGYATAGIGKWGLGPMGSEGDPQQQGFDSFFGFACQRRAQDHYPRSLWRNGTREVLAGNASGAAKTQYAHDLFEDEALRFLNEPRARPFFLYLPFTVPHMAMQVPEDSLNEYHGAFEDAPYDGRQGYLPHATPHAAFAAMVTRLDRSVGRILDRLTALGLDERTLVIFTSDNGATYGRVGGADSKFFASAAGLRGAKGSLYEGGVRVPFLARWKGRIAPNTTATTPCALYDVLPTLCALTGVPTPPHVDGIALDALFLGRGAAPQRDALYWEFPGYGGQQAARVGDWKGIRVGMDAGNTRLELFDLAHDAEERVDVAAAHPEVVARIEAVFRREHVPSSVFPLKGVDVR